MRHVTVAKQKCAAKKRQRRPSRDQFQGVDQGGLWRYSAGRQLLKRMCEIEVDEAKSRGCTGLAGGLYLWQCGN